MPRSYSELMGLEVEAERLVRMGETRAEVSRRLGVHPMTLAGWALRGGWRKKDLELERATEATRAAILAIRRGNQAADERRRVREEAVRVMREALRLMAEAGEDEGLARALELVEAAAPAMRLEAPVSPGQARAETAPDPLAAGVRSLGEADVERPDFGEVVHFDGTYEATPEPEPEPEPIAEPTGTMLDEVERWMDEAERLAAAGDMEAASRALNAAGRMRRLARTLDERAAERRAREAEQAVDHVALLRDELAAIVARIEREAAAAKAPSGASGVDEACETPQRRRDDG